MAETLIDRIAARISPELIQKASALLGEPEAGVTKGFQTAVPAVLAKFAEKAETTEGAAELLPTINGTTSDGAVLEDAGSLLDTSADSPLQDAGQQLLGTLFGRQAPEIVGGLAEDAGIQPVSMGRLMSVVSPLLLGELGQKFGGSATAEGLSELVTAQKPGILGALPATLAGVLGLGALGGLAGGLKEKASDALGAVTGAGGGAVDALKNLAGGATEKATDALGATTGAVTGAVGATTDAVKNVAGAAGGAVLGAGAAAAGLASGAAEKATDVAGGAVDAAKNLAAGAADKAGDAVDAAKNLAGGALGAVTGAAGSVGDGLKSVAGAAGGAVTGVAGKVGDVAGDTVDAVKNLAGGAVDKAGDALDATGDAVKNVAGAVGGAVLGAGAAAAGLASGAADKVGDVAGDAVDAAKNAAGAATGAVKNVAGAAGDVAGKTFDAASDAVESVTSGLPKWAIPALLGVLAIGAFAYFKGCAPAAPNANTGQTASGDVTPDPSAATPDPNAASPEATPEASPEVEATPATDANGMTEVKVGEKALQAAQGGIEDQLIAFLNDPAKQADKTTWFNFDRLLFDTGKATLKPASKAQLQNVAEILKGFPKVSVKIGGYTDNTGNPAANKKLSTDRAASVVKGLIALGIAKTRLASEGYGDQHPVASNATAEGREQNRRIAVRVTKK